MVERKSFLFLYGSFTFLHVKLTGEKKRADIYSNLLLDINMYESQMHSSGTAGHVNSERWSLKAQESSL